MRTTKTNKDIQKKAMIEALEKTLGVITRACKISGVARSAHYKWYDEDIEYRRQVDDIENITLDFVESKLHQQIEKENITAIIFHLKTKGKKRGYVERIENDVTVRELPSEQELLKEIEQLEITLGRKN